MTADVHVLVVGSVESGVCDFYRFGLYRPWLAELGVELRPWNVAARVPAALAHDPDAALAAVREGSALPDLDPIDWADVVVFRRTYATSWVCADCDTAGPDRETAAEHCSSAGHRLQGPSEPVVRALADLIDRDPSVLRGRALMYETDDDLLSASRWNGISRRSAPERDLVERIVRRADLVTTTTPVLAGRLRRHSDVVRVVRNAVDPEWYASAARVPDLPGDPRILFYGGVERMGHYAVCRPAVDALVRRHPRGRRIWLGSDRPSVVAAVDEVLPHVSGVPAFARSLVEAGPDIGLAPVLGDKYDLARSELHWLEYSLAGAATVASRTPFGGPYDVIRHGVDGLLAGSGREWRAHLERLVSSRSLREDMAGRARERVLGDYDVRQRAHEWSDAYRWAAEHAGRASQGRRYALGSPELAAAEPRWQAALEQRHAERLEVALLTKDLEELRAGRDVCWSTRVDAPLVSVPILVSGDRAALTLPEALRSALEQRYPRIEVLVGLEGTAPHVAQAVSAVVGADRRVRLVEAPVEDASLDASGTADGHARMSEVLLAACEGEWIAPLPPDAAFAPDHVASLITAAIAARLEYVAGRRSRADGSDDDGDVAVDDAPAPGTDAWPAGLRALPPALRPSLVPDARWWSCARAAGLRVGRLNRAVATPLARPGAQRAA